MLGSRRHRRRVSNERSVCQRYGLDEFQVALSLYFCRVYKVSRLHYERLFGARQRLTSSHWPGAPAAKSQARFAKSAAPAAIETGATQAAASGWQWPGFPHLPAIFNLYQHLATFYMIYVVARDTLLRAHLNRLIELDKPAHCYLMGYFHFHPELSRGAGTMFSLFHLAWRLVQALLQRPYFMPMPLFLLFTERDLARFRRRLAQSEATASGALAADATQVCRLNAPHVDAVYRLFRRVCCYKVPYRCHSSYRLRPNRSPEVRRALRRHVARCALLVAALFFALAMIINTTMLVLEFNDRQYLLRYPKCDAQLEALRATGALGAWSFSARAHQLVSICWDCAENVIIWVDSGVAVMFIMALIYLLNYDTQLHWRALDRKLQRVHLRVRAEHLARAAAREAVAACAREGREREDEEEGEEEDDSEDDSDRDRALSGSESEEQRGFCALACREHAAGWTGQQQWQPWQLAHGPAPSGLAKRAHCLRPRQPQSSPLGPAPAELEEAVHDLQAHFYDFFQQIGETDLIISDVLTATIIIWLITFSSFGRASLQIFARAGTKLDLLIAMLAVESFSIIIVTAVTLSLLELHRNCLRSHATLCSLMAYDRSRHKIRFLKLLEFYTVKKRSTYTIFQQYPYTKTTYLSIFGWSLSCLFILDNLFRV